MTIRRRGLTALLTAGGALVPLVPLVAAVASDATPRTPKSLRDLPSNQYAVEGLAGVKVVSTPLEVTCEAAAFPVGVRFTRLARRVRAVRMHVRDLDGRLLQRGPRFPPSRRWQFQTLRLGTCGRAYGIEYVFFRAGDPHGQVLGNTVCVRGAQGEDCPDPPPSE